VHDLPQAGDRWAGKVIMDIAKKTEKQSAAILKTWQDNGALKSMEYYSKRNKRTTPGLVVDQVALGEIRRTVLASTDGGLDD
jgi:hypothetical protein